MYARSKSGKECSQEISADQTTLIPINYLFFHMNEKVQHFMRLKEWESKPKFE